MIKLLIIADDFTGALDTAVKFSAYGIKTKVLVDDDLSIDLDYGKTKVLVLDAETRHLCPEVAYKVIYKIVKNAREKKIPYLYKKVDSALRGNIGKELEAVLAATGAKVVPFIPAFPEMRRTTINGIHYVDNIPVSESVFGQDPFEPVMFSSIKEIIQSQSKVKVTQVEESDGIYIYDAETNTDLKGIAEELKEKKQFSVTAGCAGFAAFLPELLELKKEGVEKHHLDEKLLIVCGSLNMITRKQLDYAEKYGAKRIYLKPEQKLVCKYWQTIEGRNKIKEIKELCSENDCCIIDSNDKQNSNDTLIYAGESDISLDDVRVKISETLGYILKELLRKKINNTVMVTGGDTLLGFMRMVGITELKPIHELMPGCVVSIFEYNGKQYNMISKSGGFGDERLIKKMIILLKNQGGKVE